MTLIPTTDCWWGMLGVYVLLSYLVLGPIVSRWLWRVEKQEFTSVVVWTFSPFSAPIVGLALSIFCVVTYGHQFLCWLIFGSSE